MIVIDGYNLMHKFYKKEIQDSDLEVVREDLIKLLGSYADNRKKRLKVYFDSKEAEGVERQQRKPNLEIIFVKNADKAIILDLNNSNSFVQIVSSDNEILRVAEKNNNGIVLSEEFVVELLVMLGDTSQLEMDKMYGISDSEVDYWKNYFDIEGDSVDKI